MVGKRGHTEGQGLLVPGADSRRGATLPGSARALFCLDVCCKQAWEWTRWPLPVPLLPFVSGRYSYKL